MVIIILLNYLTDIHIRLKKKAHLCAVTNKKNKYLQQLYKNDTDCADIVRVIKKTLDNNHAVFC